MYVQKSTSSDLANSNTKSTRKNSLKLKESHSSELNSSSTPNQTDAQTLTPDETNEDDEGRNMYENAATAQAETVSKRTFDVKIQNQT